jgi:formylglycine-generating enzyme required for sulfatase activity
MRTRWLTAALASLLLAACGDDKVEVITGEDGPPAPGWVHVAVTTIQRIELRWVDPSADESGFVIERSTSASGGFAVIGEAQADTVEYRDAEVTAGAIYYYRVLTKDSLGRLSAAPPAVMAQAADNATPATPTTPSPPNLAGDLEFTGPVTLTWEAADPDGPAPECDLYFGEAQNALELKQAGLTAYAYTLPDTLAWSRYFFWRVVARDAQGATALSPVWSFGTRIETVPVPAGGFFMGDCGRIYPTDPTTYCAPANPVTTGAFDMDKLEVSNQRFAQFLNELFAERWIRVLDGEVRSAVGDTLFTQLFPDGDEHAGIEFSGTQDEGFFIPRAGRENHPVIEVTWHGARRFAAHYGRRLPLEAEWEKSARGTGAELGYFVFQNGDVPDSVGIGLPYPWGTEMSGAYFNYTGSGDPFETTVGVATTPSGYYDGSSRGGFGTFSNASPYGILDLAGNVAEWCEDTFVPYEGGASRYLRVVRGGGWRSQPHWCQTFWRAAQHPDSTDNLIGFRTVASR